MENLYLRLFLSFLILWTSTLFLNAQEISVNLSFLDTRSDLPEASDPYLQIEYINSGKKDYYFPALASFDNTYPGYSTGIFISNHDGYHGRETTADFFDLCESVLFKEKAFQGMHYYLPLDFLQRPGSSWDLVTEKVFLRDDDQMEDPINYFLYSYADYRHNINHKTDLPYHDKYSLKKQTKLKKNPAFVFLRSGERKTQLICLDGLKGTGITLTVCLSSCYPPQKVYVGWGSDDDSYYNLPDKVQKYRLYKGKIESNMVTREF